MYTRSKFCPQKKPHSKQDIICHVAKVKPTTSAHSVADVIPFLAYIIFPSIHNARQYSAKHDITQNCQINRYQELHVFFTLQDNNVCVYVYT